MEVKKKNEKEKKAPKILTEVVSMRKGSLTIKTPY